jgi:ribosomal protein S18 acetylase RimI-like enzyme
MPRLDNPAAIRAILETDRPWAAYALADLAPGFFEACEWHALQGPAPALILLYRAFETPVLVSLGAPQAVDALLDEIGGQAEMYLSIRPEILPLIEARYVVKHAAAMWRMVLKPEAFYSTPPRALRHESARLSPADLPALQQLYADGLQTGEAPDFFSPEMVEQGVFFGIREGEALIATAGTHLYASGESVGTVGNVYTRRDRRGRGLATLVTRAVTATLLEMGLQTIVLNVAQPKAAAIHVYEGLGFIRYCAFYEGLAARRS